MSSVVIVGTQWGDEGKGKIVDWLSSEANTVVRFQGGNNAGHTLVVDGVTYKLSLLPSGVVRPSTLSILGNGVVVNPWALLDEMANIEKMGITITPDQFKIAENAILIFPFHQELDSLREKNSDKNKIGTTKKGIGPAYEDKVGRRAIRMCDLLSPETLEKKMENLLDHHNILRTGYGAELLDLSEEMNRLNSISSKLIPFIAPVWKLLENEYKKGNHILFEGAQGAFLDIDWGTYPYVTSSNTIASQATIGSGTNIWSIDKVLGITKAYTTRVGSGPFPTELDDDIGTLLGEKGHEFGTVTGRQRRCGWLDAIMVKQTSQISGVNEIVLTKIDVLDHLDEIKICYAYDIDGKTYDYLPCSLDDQKKIKPLYKSFKGWKSSTEGIQNYNDLPALAKDYIQAIEDLTQVKVSIISTSPKREDTIVLEDPFANDFDLRQRA